MIPTVEISAIAAILSNPERFQKFTSGWVQAVWECDTSGIIASDSASWRAFTGQTSDEEAHYGWADAIHPSDRRFVLEHWRTSFDRAMAVDVEFRVRKADGTWCWTNARATPDFTSDGVAKRWLGVSLDVGRRREAEVALRETEDRYQHIVESARDYAIVTVNGMGAITSWSQGATATYGWTPGQAVGRPFSILLQHHERAHAMLDHMRAPQRNTVDEFRAWHVRKNGSSVYVEGSTRVLRGSGSEATGFLLIGRDATERQRTDRTLLESEARYRTLLDSVRDHAIFLVDPHGTIEEWTAAAESVTGYLARDVVGRHMSLLYTPEDAASGAVVAELAEAAQQGRTERESWRVHSSGRRIWSDEVTTALYDAEGLLRGYSKITRDLSDRQSLAAARERERFFSQRERLRERLALAEVDERRRISRELHDVAGQHVTALALGLAALGELADADSPMRRQTTFLQSLVDLLGTELHDVAVRLRPRALDEFGFEEAIQSAVRSWSRTCGVAVDVQITGFADRLTPTIENALFRIILEALTNVARHSGARSTSVIVEKRDDQVHAIVEDDGIGFEPSSSESGALGLRGIQERVDSLDGVLQIESNHGGGTTIFVRIPV